MQDNIRKVNQYLLVILLLLGIYLTADFLHINPAGIKKEVLALRRNSGLGLDLETAQNTDLTQIKPKSLAHYLKPLNSRDLFGTQTAKEEPVKPTPSFLEMISKLRLQGIVSGTNPQAIIEDKKTRQLHFLSPGDKIDEIELKEILPGKIILKYNGQETELSL